MTIFGALASSFCCTSRCDCALAVLPISAERSTRLLRGTSIPSSLRLMPSRFITIRFIASAAPTICCALPRSSASEQLSASHSALKRIAVSGFFRSWTTSEVSASRWAAAVRFAEANHHRDRVEPRRVLAPRADLPADHRLPLVGGGEHDEREVAPRRRGLDAAAGLLAREPGDPQIEEDALHPLDRQPPARLLAVRRALRVVALAPEFHPDQLEERLAVVDGEDLMRLLRELGLLLGDLRDDRPLRMRAVAKLGGQLDPVAVWEQHVEHGGVEWTARDGCPRGLEPLTQSDVAARLLERVA